MAVLPILTGTGNQVLRTKTKKVARVTKETLKLLRDMEETTLHAHGAGLAAPQVGESLRVCIAMINQKLTPMMNPEITWRSAEAVTEEEACLSLPDVIAPVSRSREIVVRYLDENGEEQERKLRDWDARVVQHEIDHLDGVLIIDYLQPTLRSDLQERLKETNA